MNNRLQAFSWPSDASLTLHSTWCAVCVDNMPAGIFLANNTFKHHYTNKAQPKSVPVPETIQCFSPDSKWHSQWEQMITMAQLKRCSAKAPEVEKGCILKLVKEYVKDKECEHHRKINK